MMKAIWTLREKPAAGLFGGALFWYLAHDIGFYFSGYECRYDWIPSTVHGVALVAVIFCGLISWRALPRTDKEMSTGRTFFAYVGVAAAVLFSLVILWQGVAAVVYSECSR
ncbi:MAG: hypothetical protein ACJ76H_14655 [Bacteriovoracaceae bacterium]